MSKTLYEVRVVPKNHTRDDKVVGRGTNHPSNEHLVYLVEAASVSFALLALEDDETYPLASEIGKIEVNVCTRYVKLVKAQVSE